MKLTGMFEDEPNCTKNGFLNKIFFQGVISLKLIKKKEKTVFEALLIFLGLQL